MAKRSNISGYSKRLDEEELSEIEVSDELLDEISNEELDAYAEERIRLEEELNQEPKTIKLVLRKTLRLRYIGPVTGKLYVWGGAGAVVDVDKEDAEIMIMKKSNRNCCSGTPATPYFEIIE